MKVRCSYCNSEAESTAKYCPNCGHEIQNDIDYDFTDSHNNSSTTASRSIEEEIVSKRKKKAAIWGFVTIVGAVVLILNGFLTFELDDYGFGAVIICLSVIAVITGLIVSLIYSFGFTKSAVIDGHVITLDFANKTYVYVDGECVSCTYQPNTVYVTLSSETTIAVIPKLGYCNQYGGRVTDVDFVRVFIN